MCNLTYIIYISGNKMLHNKSAQQFFMVNDMVVKSVPGYLNSLKRCLLCPHEKLRLLITPNQEELLNK